MPAADVNRVVIRILLNRPRTDPKRRSAGRCADNHRAQRVNHAENPVKLVFHINKPLKEILNPVLAVAADETGVVNLFSSEGGTIEFNFVYEGILDYYKGYILVISNPKYNEYEGTIEMAGWKLLRYLPPINRTN